MGHYLKMIREESLSKPKALLFPFLQVVLGSLFLSLISIFKVPFYPTPMTLQTYGLFMIALFLGSRKGALVVIIYLIEASCGWPILAGGNCNPLWMIGPNAGFLLGFIPAVYLIGYINEKTKIKTFIKTISIVFLGQAVIYFSGLICLSFYFGFEKAIVYGVVPFLIAMPIKVTLAAMTYQCVNLFKKKIF